MRHAARRYSTSRTWRPRYQPQLPHTMCGSFTAPQFGQIERAGAASRQFDARALSASWPWASCASGRPSSAPRAVRRSVSDRDGQSRARRARPSGDRLGVSSVASGRRCGRRRTPGTGRRSPVAAQRARAGARAAGRRGPAARGRSRGRRAGRSRPRRHGARRARRRATSRSAASVAQADGCTRRPSGRAPCPGRRCRRAPARARGRARPAPSIRRDRRPPRSSTRRLEVHGTARAGMRQEVGDVDAECAHGGWSACEASTRRRSVGEPLASSGCGGRRPRRTGEPDSSRRLPVSRTHAGQQSDRSPSSAERGRTGRPGRRRGFVGVVHRLEAGVVVGRSSAAARRPPGAARGPCCTVCIVRSSTTSNAASFWST